MNADGVIRGLECQEVRTGCLGKAPPGWIVADIVTKSADQLVYARPVGAGDASPRKSLATSVLADRRRSRGCRPRRHSR